jgi:DeoR family transcriptional regulator of aga operon
MASPSRLLVEERRRRIMERLEMQERVTVDELVRHFGVSAVTIRGDLDALAEIGAVIRSYGGALRRVDAPEDVPIAVKETLHHPEKVRIGHAAAQMIQDGETIMLDSGTTTAEIARQIRFLKLRSLNVITNALNIAMELAAQPNVRLIMIGGILRQMSYSLAGPHAEHILHGLHADADSAKFHRRSLSVIAKIDAAHKVVTDSGVPEETLASLQARGVDVLVV